MKIKIKSKIFSLIMSAILVLTYTIGITGLKVFAADAGPEILITEVMPVSQNGDDAYEYFELYNNSDNNIDLKDYKLPNQNIDFTASKIIPPKGVLIICTRSTTTLEKFNAFYGTTLVDSMYMALPFTVGILGSSPAESIIVARDNSTVVVRAIYSEGDFDIKKSVTYQYPQSGFDMNKLYTKQAPTPGSVAYNQIPNSGIRVTGITLDRQYINMDTILTAVLYATVAPATAANKSVLWTSSDTNIVQVNQNGVLTAKAEGAAVITAKTVDGGFTAACVAIVSRIPVTGISLNKNNATLNVGEAIYLTATVTPENATNKKVIWSSSNSAVASVDSNGMLLGKSTGTTAITAKTADGNFAASCWVNVVNNTGTRVTGVSLDKSNITLKAGDVIILEATIKPSTASNKQVTWSSGNPAVAAVDGNGIIYAKQKGSTTITVKTADGGFTASCIITVTDNDVITAPISGIRLSKFFMYIKEGKSHKLTAIITPGNAQHKSVTWKTSDNKVAIVSSDGKVTGVGSGYCIITATTEDGNNSAECVILCTGKKSHGNGHNSEYSWMEYLKE